MMAHAPNHTHGASCVELDDAVLHLKTMICRCIFGTPMPSALPLHGVFGPLADHFVATSALIDADLAKN